MSNLTQLIKNTNKYNSLSIADHKLVVREEFGCIKKAAQKRKNKAIENFLTVNLRKDLQELGVKLEDSNGNYTAQIRICVTIIHSGLTSALIVVTRDSSASMLYCYYKENVIHCYKVKVVSWEHKDWQNLGILQRGRVAIERLADTVQKGQCGFIELMMMRSTSHTQILLDVSLTPNCNFNPTLPWTPPDTPILVMTSSSLFSEEMATLSLPLEEAATSPDAMPANALAALAPHCCPFMLCPHLLLLFSLPQSTQPWLWWHTWMAPGPNVVARPRG
ncbi:hypothetical protein CONPUDRAFT_73882 [Coniophora puteana RWD-64-598 SS2]|uniref:Uncharacterized protein n=1 Tax=Coniophora puteana (strain RWD-64-598) TaxID=741705 RepID=A0A5M3MNX1_CONPW|nr:uncharacterized protein CONPUDRAFT_73882 [Coniophora puteana RWD-64-598 SS2]EIW80872.1 hypothetical protein CONPUDRAFT_73882 [Coniophora puteana RWD-64-598 SS2]